jgi:methylase of polypeptide subunit release factors
LKNDEAEVESRVVENEPSESLFAPIEDLLYFYREIEHHAGIALKISGSVFVEVPHERAREILNLFRNPKWKAELLPDLNQRERVLVATYLG